MVRLSGTDSAQVYASVAGQMNSQGISVHLFTVGPEFTDVATIGVPSGLTCGLVHYFPVFSREELHDQLFDTLSTDYYWDACLRLRMPRDLKFVRAHTNCTLKRDNLVSFPVMASTTAVVFELEIERGNFTAPIIFQAGFVFSDQTGTRFIRVFTFATPVSSDPPTVCASVDEDALAALVGRQALCGILGHGAAAAFKSLSARVPAIAARCPGLAGPLHALLSSALFAHPLGFDWLFAEIIRIRQIDINNFVVYIRPRLFRPDQGTAALPPARASCAGASVVAVHTPERIIVWVAADMPNDLALFPDATRGRVMGVARECWQWSGRYLPVEVVRQGDPKEAALRDVLVDDSVAAGANLGDWLRATARRR
jgi:hypothetical protein